MRYLQIEIMLSGQAINVHVPMLLEDPKRSTGCRVGLALSATKACCNRGDFEAKGGGRAGGSWACDGRLCGGWVKVEASKAPSTPRVKIQKASRLGSQSVTAKSKLLALNCAILHGARAR